MAQSYPESLPGPSAFTLHPAAHALFGDNEVGPREPRVRTRDPSATASVSFRFIRTHYLIFGVWWRDDLKFGSKWFELVIPSAGGFLAHTVRFVDRYVAQYDGHTFWTVNAIIEIRDRKFVSPPLSRIDGFLTWARGIREDGQPLGYPTYISEIGPDLRSGGAVFATSGGQNGFGYFDTTNVNSYFHTFGVGEIAVDIENEGSPRAWRLDWYAKMPNYAYVMIANESLTDIVKVAVTSPGSGAAFTLSHRTSSGFGTLVAGSVKPLYDDFYHFAIEKLPNVQPMLWTDASGSLQQASFGWTTDWANSWVKHFEVGGGTIMSQARFSYWLDAGHPELYVIGGYNPPAQL